jgi:hypothetical protein
LDHAPDIAPREGERADGERDRDGEAADAEHDQPDGLLHASTVAVTSLSPG